MGNIAAFICLLQSEWLFPCRAYSNEAVSPSEGRQQRSPLLVHRNRGRCFSCLSQRKVLVILGCPIVPIDVDVLSKFFPCSPLSQVVAQGDVTGSCFGCWCMCEKHSVNICCSPLVLCSVTSSEKVDKAQRYADFTLLSIPYPGTGLMSRGIPNGQVTVCFWGLGNSSVCVYVNDYDLLNVSLLPLEKNFETENSAMSLDALAVWVSIRHSLRWQNNFSAVLINSSTEEKSQGGAA